MPDAGREEERIKDLLAYRITELPRPGKSLGAASSHHASLTVPRPPQY